jgi:hypothetical protein
MDIYYQGHIWQVSWGSIWVSKPASPVLLRAAEEKKQVRKGEKMQKN